MTLKTRLHDRAQKRGPIRVGLVGAGQMGAGMISLMERMGTMRVVATSDLLPDRILAAYAEGEVMLTDVIQLDDDVEQATDLITENKRIATTKMDWLMHIPTLDVIVECTGIPEVGAQVCMKAIAAGKHIINMNVETDCTIGYWLAKQAQEAGVVYTLSAGDEPGSIKELYDFADALGFQIVAIGKGKNNPLDRQATPDTVRARAQAQKMSAKMLASFVDGTKTMVEMTSVGNGTGYAPEIAGGYGPRCSVAELAKTFVPKADGGILNALGAVDYAIGPAPGVFVIITTDQPKVIRDLNYLNLNGHGNYWALYRPYHLANIETPISIARAVLDHEVTLATYQPPVAETVAYAKRDLLPGEKIDGLGGFTVYGMIQRVPIARAEQMLPLGIVAGATMQKPVKAGEPIHYGDVQVDDGQTIVQVRRQQDAMLYGR